MILLRWTYPALLLVLPFIYFAPGTRMQLICGMETLLSNSCHFDVLSFLSLASGFIPDMVTLGRREAKRLCYQALPSPPPLDRMPLL